MQDDSPDSPPRAPPIKYTAPLGTRWGKEKAAAGGAAAFDLPTDPKNIGPWILGECIGKGASGRVKIARHRRTRQLAAVKILPITPLVNSRASLATQKAKTEKQRLGIDREITMMKLMNHPNIMRIYDVYEGEKELFLVLEYVEGGELFDFLVNRGRLPPGEALLYFRQIIYGLNYAHTFSIIHRDLKPENILIASLEPPIIKIADWGMAAFAPPSLQLETSCGSPHYASPEIVNGEKYFGTATDIWSCGVILFALLTGRLPFDDKNVRVLLSKVKSGKYEMPAWIDPLARDLLTRMLVVDVHKRITIPEIIAHPWFTKLTTTSSSHLSPAHHPVLPPSPSILARPIPSPDLIDSELFNSLRVIWGRHAEAQTASIQMDLCSPAGQGTYAKAFYFLLNKYREETLRSRYDDDQTTLVHTASDSDARASTPSGTLDSSDISQPQSLGIGPSSSDAPGVIHAGNSLDSAKQPRSPSRVPPGARQISDDVRKLAAALASGVAPHKLVPSSNQHLSRPPMARRTYHPSEMRRATQPVMSPVSRPTSAAASHRSATDIAERTSARPNLQSIPKPSHLPFRPPSPVFPIRMASSSAMDIDPKVDDNNDLTHLDPRLHRAHAFLTGRSIAAYSAMAVVNSDAPRDPVPGVGPGAQANPREDGHIQLRESIVVDKENIPINEDWTHVQSDPRNSRAAGRGPTREMGREVGNRASFIPVPLAKAKKERERKSRPPPLELAPGQHQRRNTIGSPLQNNAPHSLTVPGPTPSNRPQASPVVSEFRGWFSNLFNWKPGGSSAQPTIFYSMEDGPQTRDLAFAMFQSMGYGITRHTVEQTTENCEVYQCRLDQFVSDPQTAHILKPNRFRVEFYFMAPTMAPSTFPPPSPAPMAFSTAGSPYLQDASANYNPTFIASPVPSPNHLSATPTPVAGGGGRNSSGTSTPTTATTPTGSTTPTTWDIPPGCSCVITLMHEKGSTTSFKVVRERLREVFDARGMALSSCFSPAMPNTPFSEGMQYQQRVG
ncbi:CAMK/CAMKL/GIN4 protein kinase [Ephemerocybe angulata]|uniref:CAMK/CAMKL/GIN4 protein kinase n=1 Tax=Ephemerocybe angulata TaxID=980116 RepID=A0A8H6MGS3_9AGAR|nr:CAMK/CAMKL/GIN4 protein kinase [Tulosesus angulatus]